MSRVEKLAFVLWRLHMERLMALVVEKFPMRPMEPLTDEHDLLWARAERLFRSGPWRIDRPAPLPPLKRTPARIVGVLRRPPFDFAPDDATALLLPERIDVRPLQAVPRGEAGRIIDAARDLDTGLRPFPAFLGNALPEALLRFADEPTDRALARLILCATEAVCRAVESVREPGEDHPPQAAWIEMSLASLRLLADPWMPSPP